LNALYGAGSAAERLGDVAKAKFYYGQLTSIANTAHSNKKQLVAAKMFLDSHP
jgi:hypothetical protein